MKNVYKKFPRNSFFYRFFKEKNIPERNFEVYDSEGTYHLIPNTVVVEHIANTRGTEKRKIENILRKIDFHNGDVNHFLAHLATAIANNYSKRGKLAATKMASKDLDTDDLSLKKTALGDRYLRKGLIRIAYENPDLRSELFPLIKESSSGKKVVGASFSLLDIPDFKSLERILDPLGDNDTYDVFYDLEGNTYLKRLLGKHYRFFTSILRKRNALHDEKKDIEGELLFLNERQQEVERRYHYIENEVKKSYRNLYEEYLNVKNQS